MSTNTIASWHSGELSLNSTDSGDFNFAPSANDQPVLAHPLLTSDTVYGSTASGGIEALSLSYEEANNAVATAPSLLSDLKNAGIRTHVANLLGANDSLSYEAMLHILDSASVGGMTVSKFGTLQTLASLMNVAGGISTSAYVQNISHNLIDGDPANAYWTGGAPTEIPLGDLSATATHTQVDELIGKWFLGTDLPSMDLTGKNSDLQYEDYSGPLFGKSGVPSYLDVNQGALGDCWFLATLAEVALQDPSAIESMIASNGNGTYGVRFFVDGAAEYVTVNSYLPTANTTWDGNGSNLQFANGAAGEPLWAELIEKAFAQLNAEPDAVHGDGIDRAVNAYEGIAGGFAQDALAEITNQGNVTYTSGHLVSDASAIGEAFDSGEEVELSTPGKILPKYQHDLVPNHVFEVIGYNASTEAFTLHNPWGSISKSPMTFTLSASALAAVGCTMDVAEGPASGELAAAHAGFQASIVGIVDPSHSPLGHALA
jgi:Calpain family cysteine protease